MLYLFLYLFTREKHKLTWLKISIFMAFITMLYISTLPFIDKSSCPLCFHEKNCSQLENVKVNIFSLFLSLFRKPNAKSILFGTLDNIDVVIKTIEISVFKDFQLTVETDPLFIQCMQEPDLFSRCNQQSACRKSVNNLTGYSGDMKKFVLCPSTESFSVLWKSCGIKHPYVSCLQLMNIITTLVLDPEPLILQLLPREEGWPVPTFIGACGNTFVESYTGDMLISKFDLPWLSRAHIAAELLKAAQKFLFKHETFAIYITDISPYNIGVDVDGTITFLDLDNIVLVDKTSAVNDSRWELQHSNEVLPCDDNKVCFSFAVQDICSHKLSDINFYSVCQHILFHSDETGRGLLDNIPDEILSEFPLFLSTLSECSKPSIYASRIQAAGPLIAILDNILLHYNFQWPT